MPRRDDDDNDKLKFSPPKPMDPPPEDPIRRIEKEAEGTPIAEALETLREAEAQLLNIQAQLDDPENRE